MPTFEIRGAWQVGVVGDGPEIQAASDRRGAAKRLSSQHVKLSTMASSADARSGKSFSNVSEDGANQTQRESSTDGLQRASADSVHKPRFDVGQGEDSDNTESQAQPSTQVVRRVEYLQGWALVWGFFGWLLTEFMGGLGGNMLSPALPIVASKFNALDQMGWVSGAYYMAQCGCMLLFGQWMAIFNAKHVLLAAVAFFMVGSAISGGAQNVETLILGRAVAGVGSAGCWVSVVTLVALLVELKRRPLLMGLFGIQNAISGTVGPIVAGCLTNSGLWRMCFLIVLPLGALTILFNWFALPSVPPLPIQDDVNRKLDRHLASFTPINPGSLSETARRWLLIDWVGYATVTASLVCFILALQWGGSTFPWKSPTIIGLFIGFGAIMALFVLIEHYAPCPMMPLAAWKNRTVVAAAFMTMLTLMSNLFAAVFIPLLYEAGRGVSALHAGVMVIPFLLTIVLSQATQGFIMTITKRYWHWGWTSPVFLAIGGGLLYTVDSNTSGAALIGYQIIYGLGIGCSQSVAFLAVQADNEEWLVPSAIAIISFTQLFGGMCGPVIGNAVLQSGLSNYLTSYGVDDAVIAAVKKSVFSIWKLDSDVRATVIKGYLRALNNIYIGTVPISAILIVCGLIIRNRSLADRAFS